MQLSHIMHIQLHSIYLHHHPFTHHFTVSQLIVYCTLFTVDCFADFKWKQS